MLDIELRGINLNFAKAGATATAGATTVTIATAVTPAINGQFGTALAAGAKALSLVDAVGKPSAGTTLFANRACTLVHCVDAAGTLKTIQGPYVYITDGVLEKPIAFPSIPDSLAPVAYFTVRTGATLAAAGFTPGTTNWDAAGVTTKAFDVAVLPHLPVFP